MKNIFKFLFLTLVVASFTACEDIDKDPHEANGIDGPFGTFIRLDISTAAVLDVTDIDNTSFGGTVSNPSGNVASYEMKVRRVSNGSASDYQTAFTTTSFPAEMVFTPASLAALFGLTSADLIPGDRFDFEGTSIGANGEVVTFDDFGPNLQGNPAQAQGYRFVTFLSCPFIQADGIGTYDITNAPFFGQLATTVEAVAGPGGGLTLIDPMGNLLPGDAPDKYNVNLTITQGSGQTAVGSQVAWDSSHPHPNISTPYGIGNMNGGGFVFSCAGSIVLNLTFTVAAGSFGSAPYVAQKQ